MEFSLDRNNGVPLSLQIYHHIRMGVLNGNIASGSRLPSTRDLSCSLSTSRMTVVDAYEQLIAEGYAQGTQGSGTWISPIQRWEIPTTLSSAAKPPRTAIDTSISFHTGQPDPVDFSTAQLNRLGREILSEMTSEDWKYGDAQGLLTLREELSDYLYRQRGMRTNPLDIHITTGTTQGIAMVSHIRHVPGAQALVENPASEGLIRAIRSHGYALVPQPADDHGMITDNLPKNIPYLRVIHVTPSHQFPLGGILPIQRRLALLRYAEQQDAIVLEDDYDSEFRFMGSPISPLFTLSPDRVLYSGSFSKTLAPALRLGYLVAPPAFRKALRITKRYSDVHTGILEQRLVLALLQSGELERHIRRMRTRYAKKREVLVQGLYQYFGDSVRIRGDAAGLHLTASFADIHFTPERLQFLEKGGVHVVPLTQHCIQPTLPLNALVLGYGHLTQEQIKTGLHHLSRLLKMDVQP